MKHIRQVLLSEVRGCRVCSSKIALSRLSRLGAAVISLLCSHWVIYQAAAQAIGYEVHAPVLAALTRGARWQILSSRRLRHTAGTYRSVTVALEESKKSLMSRTNTMPPACLTIRRHTKVTAFQRRLSLTFSRLRRMVLSILE